MRGGLLSLEEACSRYTLTVDEFLSWQVSIDQFGLAGLRTTRIQQYRHEAPAERLAPKNPRASADAAGPRPFRGFNPQDEADCQRRRDPPRERSGRAEPFGRSPDLGFRSPICSLRRFADREFLFSSYAHWK